MGRSQRLFSLVSVTVVTTMGWVTLSYAASTYAQDKPNTKAAQPKATLMIDVDTSEKPDQAQINQDQTNQAQTLDDPNIEVEDLALLSKPLTLPQLQNEAEGWFLLLQDKVQQVSEEEVIIRREKRAIDARNIALETLEEAEASLDQVETARSETNPGTSSSEAFLQPVAEARTAIQNAELATEMALRAEEKVTTNSAFQAALAKAQQEQSIVRTREVLKSAQAWIAQLPVQSAEYPSISKQVKQLSEAISIFDVTDKRLRQMPSDAPSYGKLRKNREESRTRSQKLALALIEQVPELADEVVIAEIEISQKEGAAGLAETTKGVLQSAISALENIEAQLNDENLDSEGFDSTTAQTAKQQLEASRQELQRTVQQEADLKNQIVVDATKIRSQQIAIIDRLETILDELDAKGGDSGTYRQYIRAVSGLDLDVTDIASLGIRLKSWVQSDEGGLRWRQNLLTFVSVALAFTLLSYLLSLILKFILKYFTDSSSALQELAVLTVRRGGAVAGILIALTALEVSLTPLLAVLGGASFVLAFALQSNLSNIASGLMMMWHKPFDVNDHVRIAEIVGFVKEINLINTVIRTSECDTYVLPNELVWSNVIMNSTTEGRIRRSIPIQVDFDVDVQQVESLLLEIAASHPKVLEDPKPTTQVRFADSYVMIRLRPWMMPQDYDRLPTDLHRMITERFQQEGIAIAIPAQSVRYEADNGTDSLPMSAATPVAAQQKVSV